MKKLFLILIFAATLYGTPPELKFLESLLPNSKFEHTTILKGDPSAIIIAEYSGDDSIETVVKCLNKAMGVRLVEIPDSDKKDLSRALWEARSSNPADFRKRFQAEGITIDIGIHHIADDSSGIVARNVLLYIVRKGA